MPQHLDSGFSPPSRLLLGPGPSAVEPRVLRALSQPLIGHLDPAFVDLMDRLQAQLRTVFRTANAFTLPLAGTGSAGMEACLVNLLEPGDRAVIGVHGVFGGRMCEVARRTGATVVAVEASWGEALSIEAMCAAIRRVRPRVVGLVHGETSTGVLQPVTDIAACAREVGALVVLDCVTSLGGVPVEIDAWGIDVAYSGSQKCLSCPPGQAPVTFSERALERIRARTTPVPSWYLDVTLLGGYWGGSRTYHHTAPISMNYALHEALRGVLEEGLEARFRRHLEEHRALVDGLTSLGLELLVAPELRLPMLTAVKVPDGIDPMAVQRTLLEQHGIEIGAGLGPLRGRIWRIGLMGASCTRANVEVFLAALGSILRA